MATRTRYLDMGGLTPIVDGIRVGATKPGQVGTELTGTEILYLDGLTAGTATASKAVVLGASKEIATITTATITNITTTTLTPTTIAGTPNFTGAVTAASTLGVTGVTTPIGGIAAAASSAVRPNGWWVGNTAPQVSTDFNNSTPSITETYNSRITVPCNCTITGVTLFNGTDVTGNVTVGLATAAGVPITAAKSASTAGSGTDALQRIPFATPYAAIGPADYWIQVQYSSANARYNTHVLGDHPVVVQTSQTYGTLTTLTPATTFTTVVGNVAALY